MKNIFAIFALFAIAAMAACSRPDPSQLIDQAEEAMANNDTATARACCAELSDQALTSLTPSLLCRQALVYARLAENGDEMQDMASAAQCMQRALTISADSVSAFYRQLDVDCRAQLELVKAITTKGKYGN